MKTSSLLLVLFMAGFAYAENQITNTIDFGGGLNLKTIPTQIEDNESPDMVNMVNDRYGSSFKRDGSERYIAQAISSSPCKSLYRVYVPTNAVTQKALLMTNNQSIFYSTNDASPVWVNLSSGLVTPNQNFSYAMMNGLVFMAGDAQTDNMKKFDLVNSSFTNALSNFVSTESVNSSTEAVNVRPKYLINANNYLIGANCLVNDFVSNVSTSYPTRIYYSSLVNPSSFTNLRYIDFDSNNGDQITGIGLMKGFVNVFMQESIFELSFSNLNLLAFGGDQKVVQFIQGFGCVAPKTLQSDGNYYYFLAKDGVRRWDGGEKSRLNVAEESEIISGNVKPAIDALIKSGKYVNAVGKYYPKKGWYILAFEDTNKAPVVNNSVLVYDIVKEQWFKFNNWNVSSMETFDSFGDQGQLVFGDSNDGYVYTADLPIYSDDPRKELILDTMDSTWTWTRGVQDTVNVKEGTASQKMNISASVNNSSITSMGLFNVGEWPDKSVITKNDLLSFKVFPSSVQNISSLRVDVEMKDVAGDFDSNFTSVTFSSNALTAGNTAWTTIEVALSSFTILADWIDLTSGTLVFADTLSWYGIRFVTTGTADASVSIDDLRIAGASKNPLNAYRFTKQFNIGNPVDKKFNGIILTREAGSDSSYSMDVINNFGQVSNRYDYNGSFGKEIFVGDYNGGKNVTKLSSLDFSVLDSTQAMNKSIFSARPIAVDDKYVYVGDQFNNRIFSVDKSTLSSGVFVSSMGTIGSGNNQFDRISEMAVDDKYLYVCDSGNRRFKIHNKKDLTYVNSLGTLGSGTTSYDFPTGIAVDDKFVYVADDGNYRINKYDKNTLALKNTLKLNLNIIGDTSLSVDETGLYDCYKIRSNAINYLDLVLEKRNKNDLSLISKTVIRPQNNQLLISSYSIMGDISLSDRYVYVTFTDDINANGSYYIQKISKSDFSIIKEYKTNVGKFFSATANGYAYLPKVKQVYQPLNQEGSYIQFKFYDSSLDNNFKLINQTFIYDQRPIQERN